MNEDLWHTDVRSSAQGLGGSLCRTGSPRIPVWQPDSTAHPSSSGRQLWQHVPTKSYLQDNPVNRQPASITLLVSRHRQGKGGIHNPDIPEVGAQKFVQVSNVMPEIQVLIWRTERELATLQKLLDENLMQSEEGRRSVRTDGSPGESSFFMLPTKTVRKWLVILQCEKRVP